MAKCAPAMLERAWSGIEERRQELLGLVEVQRQAEEIGFTSMRILFVTGCRNGSELQQEMPRRILGEEFFLHC